MKFVLLALGVFLVGQSSFANGKILVVVSAAHQLRLGNGEVHATGYFLGELVEPLEILQNEGFEFAIATPGGTRPTLDRDSERWIYWRFNSSGRLRAQEFVRSNEALSKPLTLEALKEEDLQHYVGLFVPGGHGPMVDLFNSPAMASVLMHFHRAGKPIGLICHAPVVLLSLRDIQPWPFSGYSMTVFSNIEEKIAELLFLGGPVPFYPQTELQKIGAHIETAIIPSLSFVQRDRELVTGQNPASPRQFGHEYMKALKDYLKRGRLN